MFCGKMKKKIVRIRLQQPPGSGSEFRESGCETLLRTKLSKEDIIWVAASFLCLPALNYPLFSVFKNYYGEALQN